MPHVLTLVEQFWHKVPGGTAKATERTLAALLDLNEFTITGLSAARRADISPLRRNTTASFNAAGQRWAQVPDGVDVHRYWLPRPALYESWIRLGWPSIDRLTGPESVFWASSLIVAPTSRPVVSTVHDLDFLHTPQLLSRRGRDFFPRMWQHALKRSDRLICPSEAVAQQCLSHGAEKEVVRVIPWGVDPPSCPVSDVDRTVARLLARIGAQSARLPEETVLLVAPDQPRKNPQGCAEAIAELGCPVVIVGPGPTAEDPDFFARLGKDAIRVGTVSNHELSALYQQASVLLFPSLAEGFGLPVAEAMAHGLPVITSRATATAEVAGGAAMLVEPTDTDAIIKSLDHVLTDLESRRQMEERGLARAAELTWKSTAEGYAAMFREVL